MVPLELEDGYAVVDRVWEAGDSLELYLPMPPRKVLCDERVPENRGRAAIQRGPLVYCVEGLDAEAPLDELEIGEEGSLRPGTEGNLLGGIVSIRGNGFRAVPYYAWANRGVGAMRVWLGR